MIMTISSANQCIIHQLAKGLATRSTSTSALCHEFYITGVAHSYSSRSYSVETLSQVKFRWQSESQFESQSKQQHPHLRSFGTYKYSKSSEKTDKPHNRRRRPMVHLSSAQGEKYKAKNIGTPHPVIPHKVTPRRSVPEHLNIQLPSYAKNGTLPSDLDYESNSDRATPSSCLAAVHKDERSIQGMRKACQLAAQMLQLASSMVAKKGHEGLTTDAIDKVIHERILQAGGYPSSLNYQSFPKSICTSINEVACHGIPDLRPLEVGVYLDGFHGDNCTTVLVGNADEVSDLEVETETVRSATIPPDIEERSERAKALMNTTEQAMMSAINICHAKTRVCEIGNVIQQIADDHGYRIMKRVHGHGIGARLHMFPEIKHYRNKDPIMLEAGMAITIEPVLVEGHGAHIVFEDGWTTCTVDGGLASQFEHTILIQESGPPEILTLNGASE